MSRSTKKRPSGGRPPERSGRSGGRPQPPRHRTPQRVNVRAARPWWQQPWTIAGGAAALIVVIVVVAVVASRGSGTPPAGIDQPVPAAVLQAVTSPSPSVLASVGTGGLTDPLVPVQNPQPLTGAGGKPATLYIGADYCPFCAAERWSLVVALSRFGTFSGLKLMVSADSPEAYPDTNTFTFHGATYSSPYIDFQHVELETRDRQPLDTMTPQQQQIFSTYDTTPYTTQPGGIPFVDYGGRWLSTSSGFVPSVLQGLTWQQIANDLSSPGSPVAKAILGNANYITAAVCALTNNQPAAVCTSPPVPTVQAALPKPS